jgi:hypothetical protein
LLATEDAIIIGSCRSKDKLGEEALVV